MLSSVLTESVMEREVFLVFVLLETIFCRNHGALVKMEPKQQLLYHILLHVPLMKDIMMLCGYLKRLVSILYEMYEIEMR